MTLMHALSHGTQDLYPDFLKSVHRFAPSTISYLAIFYNIGAIAGGITFGYHSERFGRRRTMIAALVLSLLVIPLWAFGSSFFMLALGAIVMQIGVQGAWGIIPAHLSELSPNSVRGFLPGFAYQCGVLVAGSVAYIEALFAERMSYAMAMSATAATVFAGAALVIALGREKRGINFGEVVINE